MAQSIYPITMPRWGIEMLRGTITEWHFAVGQPVKKGDSLVDVETDKIVNAVESPFNGVLRKIIAARGETFDAGTLIAVIADASVTDGAVEEFVNTFSTSTVAAGPDPLAAAAGAAVGGAAAAPGGVSPIARRLAERMGIDIARVKGSGINGRVSKEDVEAYAAANAGAPPSSAAAAALKPAGATPGIEPAREKMSPTRLTIAKRLLESTQGIPHYRLEIDADFQALTEVRKARTSAAEAVSINDFVIRAAALALMKHPAVNAQLIGDEILTFPHADIGIAVVTPKGLVTPVLRQADTKTVTRIGAEAVELAARARAGTLSREEITGGSFTISNLGMFGIDRFDAIINPPQVAILAVGAATERVVARDGRPAVRRMATLTLSADHRVIDGALGAQFLAALKTLLESPETL